MKLLLAAIICFGLTDALHAQSTPPPMFNDDDHGDRCIDVPDSERKNCLQQWAKDKFGPPSAGVPADVVQKQMDCISHLYSRPAVQDLLMTLGAFQSRLTPAQAMNMATASPKDSGVAQSIVDGEILCGTPANQRKLNIWRTFAAGAINYGQAGVLLWQDINQSLKELRK